MTTAARIRIVTLRKWFPPHDPLAAKIARLCILREDLLLEMQGVYVEDIKELDESSPLSRRMYFLRNLIRTQMELSGAIQTLLKSPEFKELLDKAPEEIQKGFREAAAIIGNNPEAFGFPRFEESPEDQIPVTTTAEYSPYKAKTAQAVNKEIPSRSERIKAVEKSTQNKIIKKLTRINAIRQPRRQLSFFFFLSINSPQKRHFWASSWISSAQ